MTHKELTNIEGRHTPLLLFLFLFVILPSCKKEKVEPQKTQINLNCQPNQTHFIENILAFGEVSDCDFLPLRLNSDNSYDSYSEGFECHQLFMCDYLDGYYSGEWCVDQDTLYLIHHNGNEIHLGKYLIGTPDLNDDWDYNLTLFSFETGYDDFLVTHDEPVNPTMYFTY